MELIADILLIAGAVGAAFYCVVLSRRLSRFTNLEKGVGGAIAVLSAQVDDMTRMLTRAQGTANGSTDTLAALTDRAEDVARRLELLVASMHDLPQPGGGESVSSGVEAAAPAPKPEPEPGTGSGFTDAGPSEPPAPEPASIFRSQRGWMREAAE